ncbi:hypothetical protein EV421DRAFT_1930276 [Armillaria borealis]|uniref:Uncharacterized protein n=1 Tax=Armillaria borealis TaxID=47425 RepID=A0AA39MEJ7_9AGAR|nr:hypothetical protein EV421DRAFT_1930276 [Armillaria borealis]
MNRIVPLKLGKDSALLILYFSPQLQADHFLDHCPSISTQAACRLQVARSLKMLLLIVLFGLQFFISCGFRFDDFSGTVTVGIPITVSWHRDVNDTAGPLGFGLTIIDIDHNFPGPPFSLKQTDTTQPDGTFNVTFPAPGKYMITATDYASTSKTFDVALGDYTVPPTSVLSMSAPFVSQSREPSGSVFAHYDTWDVAQHPFYNSSFTESLQSTATAPPKSHSTHQNRKTHIVIGAVIGSLVSLLLIFGGGAFLCIRRRKHRNRKMKHRLSPNPKIIHELNSHSPPVRNKNSEAITHTLAGEMAPNVGSGSQEPVEESPEGNPTDEEGERRDSIGTPVHVDTSEPQSAPQQEAALDVVAEVVRLRTQFQQFIVEREAERVQGNALDPPPAYV